jgi:hypothetical protein
VRGRNPLDGKTPCRYKIVPCSSIILMFLGATSISCMPFCSNENISSSEEYPSLLLSTHILKSPKAESNESILESLFTSKSARAW